MNNKNILVIHPEDPTTDVLCQIYRDINATVVRQPISSSKLKKLMKSADRIIMLGHGTENGLGRATYKNGYATDIVSVVDSSLVYLLREKKDNVYIWCHADEFVKRYDLGGFSTGMFISEVEEAEYFNVSAAQEEITESNEMFSRIMKENIHKSGQEIVDTLKREYTHDSDVARYNHERLYNFRKI
jgi:hypothetical protein